MRVLAIDPGPTESGWAIIHVDDGMYPVDFGKTANTELLPQLLELTYDTAVIEMIASYGMAVGKEIFETCVWIGRYLQVITELGLPVERTNRLAVKLHHCHTTKANDANITKALVDRFAAGQPNHGKGTKTHPGFFHGFKADIWAAYALAVQHADTHVAPPLRSVHTLVHNV